MCMSRLEQVVNEEETGQNQTSRAMQRARDGSCTIASTHYRDSSTTLGLKSTLGSNVTHGYTFRRSPDEQKAAHQTINSNAALESSL